MSVNEDWQLTFRRKAIIVEYRSGDTVANSLYSL